MPITPEDRLNRNIADLEKRITEIQEDLKEINNESIDGLEKELKKRQLILEKIEEEIKLKRLNNEDTKELREREELIKRLIESQNELLEEQREILEDIKDLPKSFADDLSKSLGIITDINESGLGQTYNLFKKSGGVLKGINNAAEHLSKDLLPRIGVSMLEKAQELFLVGFHQLDEVGATLARNIPQGREYQKMIENIAATSGQAYLNFEDAGNALESINHNFASFNQLGKPAQQNLIYTGALMEKLGVDTETFGENLNTMNKAFGMSTDEYGDFQKRLFGASKSLGISVGVLNKNFGQMSERLSQFKGQRAEKIFLDMALASKNTGIEMDKLLEITERFTTFEGAATAAGKLNAVLGGNVINSLDLMNASLDDPIKTFELLKGAVDKSGKSFKEMSPAMKRVISDATGIDIKSLDKLMSQPLSKGRAELEKMTKEQQKMDEEAAKAATVVQKLTRIWYSFAQVISPIVDIVSSIVDWLAKFIKDNPNFAKVIGIAAVGFLALATAITGAVSALVMFSAVAKTIPTLPLIGKFFGGGKGGILAAGTEVGRFNK